VKDQDIIKALTDFDPVVRNDRASQWLDPAKPGAPRPEPKAEGPEDGCDCAECRKRGATVESVITPNNNYFLIKSKLLGRWDVGQPPLPRAGDAQDLRDRFEPVTPDYFVYDGPRAPLPADPYRPEGPLAMSLAEAARKSRRILTEKMLQAATEFARLWAPIGVEVKVHAGMNGEELCVKFWDGAVGFVRRAHVDTVIEQEWDHYNVPALAGSMARSLAESVLKHRLEGAGFNNNAN
jgi:hypothetical protein